MAHTLLISLVSHRLVSFLKSIRDFIIRDLIVFIYIFFFFIVSNIKYSQRIIEYETGFKKDVTKLKLFTIYLLFDLVQSLVHISFKLISSLDSS